MNRVRSGPTQIFREKNKEDREYIGDNNFDVSLKHENKQMFAELIEGEWYWVNGCAECNGEERGWKTYIECEKHDRCSVCFINRKHISGAVWGSSKGWICRPCKAAEKLEIRRQAFEEFNKSEHDDWDFTSNNEIICPHCGSEIGKDGMHESQDIECHVCEGEIILEVEYTATYSTSIKGKRVTE